MLVQNKNFNLKQIAQSGQCFRMNQIEDNRYSLVAFGHYLELVQIGEDMVELSCNEQEFETVWKDYFDLTYDYDVVVQTLLNGNDTFLIEAVDYGKGIRILQQEPFEMMISFIISQNKNIPAIKNCIEALCKQYGEEKRTRDHQLYYTFPSPLSLAKAEKETLRCLKTGYRDEYILSAAQEVAAGRVDLEKLKKVGYDDAKKVLKSIHGIGEKVANCICLYGLHYIEVFPIDVWIARVLKEIYQDQFQQEKYEGYAGIVQQYMFYYMRQRK